MNSTSIIDLTSTEYPTRITDFLNEQAPKHLYTQGNLDLLHMTSVGFSGARNVSSTSLNIAKYCAIKTVKHGLTVISGNARGVDRASHIEALKNGGSTIFVLPQGFNTASFHSSIKPYLTTDNHLIISEFAPNEAWSVKNAMQRNRTIIGLSHAMLVIEAGETGGTYSCGLDALKMGHLIYALNHGTITTQNRGNRKLIEQGAIPLGKNRRTNNANIQKVFEAVS